jgi:hypothetical protein
MTKARDLANGGFGLVLVKPSSVVGGTDNGKGTVSFSAQSTVSLNGVFNSIYKNYRLVLDFSVSTTLDINFRMRSAGSDNSTANSYNRQSLDANGTGTTVFRNAGDSHLMGGGATTAVNFITMDITRPFLVDTTGFNMHNQRSTSNAFMMLAVGFHNQSFSYDGITLLTSTGNMTGTVSVYGYNN